MHPVTARRVSGLLAVLCVAEAALAAAAWLAPSPGGGRPGNGAPPSVSAKAPRATGLDSSPLASFSAFVERPLFLSSRRPPPVAAAVPPSGMSDASARGVVFGPYRFTGIVVTPRVRIAFVTEMKTGKSIVLAEGDKLGDWRCAEIKPGRVALEKGGRQEVIEFHGGR